MGTADIDHRRRHNLLLISKLLNQRDAASPFTLVFDTLEQSARTLTNECLYRANRARTRTVYVSLESLKSPSNADDFLPLWRDGIDALPIRMHHLIQAGPATQRILIIIDCLNLLCASSTDLPALLSSFLRPNVSLLAVYHSDVPVQSSPSARSPYQPSQINMLRYLATSIITVHSLHHLLEEERAKQQSKAAPTFGLDQGLAGAIVGTAAQDQSGLVMELEFRRKSGRGVTEWYFLPRSASKASKHEAIALETITLLEDHPKWVELHGVVEEQAQDAYDGEVTFNTGLTERQRQDREAVILPYTNAQSGDFEGGRILYDMTAEDDFDDEEDEI